MDENYLDDLLKGVSTDNQKKNNFDKTVDKDSGVDIDFSDLDDISLDELDNFDNLELEDLDFDDIDFDDLDVTNLETSSNSSTSEYIPEEEEFDADDMLEESFEDDSDINTDINTEDTMLSEADIESLFAELEDNESSNQSDISSSLDGFEDVFKEAQDEHTEDIESMDLDDLFSALGIDETEGVGNDSYVSGEAELDQLFQSTMESSFDDDTLADIVDIGEKPKKSKGKIKGDIKEKKTMSEILFGAPDEDDAEEERLFELKKIQKEEKKAKKKEEQDAKKALKQEKLALKQQENAKKQSEKADKKRIKDAELLAEFEAEKGTKKVPTAVVIIVFAAFAALAIIVVLGAKNFNYSQVIKKASDYFDRQRYRLAYDEVSGVEIKEEDEELRDRIYTVMYVERLYESYENNMTLGRPDKALDSLLRGLEKYDEHYNEAVTLGIAKDIKSCKEKIVNALWNTYGLTESAAYELMSLTGVEYSEALLNECEGLMPTGE